MLITWSLVAKVLSALVLVGGALGVIKGWFTPIFGLKEKVDQHDEDIRDIKDTVKEIKESLEKGNHMNTMQLVSMMNMMDHMIYGNHTENMLNTKSDIQKLLGDNTDSNFKG